MIHRKQLCESQVTFHRVFPLLHGNCLFHSSNVLVIRGTSKVLFRRFRYMSNETNILIVEDNRGSILLFNEVLNRSEKNVKSFTEKSAESAISFLKRSKEKIDLIILDLNMPREDGWFVMDEISNQKLESSVVILTTSINKADRFKAKEYKNIIGFFNKPINLKKMNDIFDYYERSKK